MGRVKPGHDEKNPAATPGFSKVKVRLRSVAILNATEAPVVTIPIALTHPTAGRRRRCHIDGSRLLARDCAADDRSSDNATGNRRAKGALRARRRRGERGERCDRKQRGKCLLHVWDSPERCGASRAPGDLTRD